MTCTTAPLHAIFSLFASLQHFYYALKIILPWRYQITRLSVSIETPRHIYHFSMIFYIYFCRVAEFFLQTLLLSKGCFINSVAPATSTCHHTSTIFLNSQFPSYLHLYITLCCPHHDVNIISTPLRLVIAHFTQIYVDRHFVYLFEKKRERSFWIGNSLSHLQCCCLMQLLLLGWKTSWMVNEYNMQIVVEWQMVLWCKK